MDEIINKMLGLDASINDVEYGKEDEAIADLINKYKQKLQEYAKRQKEQPQQNIENEEDKKESEDFDSEDIFNEINESAFD